MAHHGNESCGGDLSNFYKENTPEPKQPTPLSLGAQLEQMLQSVQERGQTISEALQPMIINLLLSCSKKLNLDTNNSKISDILDKTIKEEKQAIIDFINAIK
jgi:hypothetical protein